MYCQGLQMPEFALRLKDGVTVLSNFGDVDNSPNYTGTPSTHCYFCHMDWKHYKLAHIHHLEQSLHRLKNLLGEI
jgi:hypothetical protein